MIDVTGILAGWAERLFGNWKERQAVDTRIADKAKLLRRTLKACYSGISSAPEPDAAWAVKFVGSLQVTEPALREIVDLRPGATAQMRHAVGRARDEYYAAADLVNPLFAPGPTGETPMAANPMAEWARQACAKARHRMYKCLVFLAWIDGEKN